jgi:hypothetical protein
MERNDNFGSTGAGQQGGMDAGGTLSQGGSQGFGAGAAGGASGGAGSLGGSTGGTTGGSTGGFSGGSAGGSTGGMGGDAMPGDRQGGVAGVAHSLADKASGAASSGKEALTDRLGAVKGKASDLKSTLAEKLEQGAEALRNRAQASGTPGGQQQFAGAAAGLLSNEKVQGYSNTLAGGLQGAADMLRDGDLQASLEKQVRENPARTLLIALGLGYVIGKAVRK